MRIVAIIQARMGSTRLLGKVLKDIGGETMLARVLRRVQRVPLLDEVIVATTERPTDDPIVVECKRLGVLVFRGDEQDVLDRYYQAAKSYEAEVVVRITSDCPLIDPEITEQVIRAFLREKPDFASIGMVRTYPQGLDTAVMTMGALARAWSEASESYQRAHVTAYIYQNPQKFRLLSVTGERDYSNYRWTVDTAEDLEFVRAIYASLGNHDSFTWLDVLNLLSHQPKLIEFNQHIEQKALEEG